MNAIYPRFLMNPASRFNFTQRSRGATLRADDHLRSKEQDMKLQARMTYIPESPEAAARVLAMLLARDGRIDWREMDVLERMDAFRILGIERDAFVELAKRIRTEPDRPSEARGRVFEPEFREIGDRRLQLLLSGLLVHIAEVDGEVAAEESALVRQAFVCWGVSPEMLRRHMSIPVPRSLAALGMLPEDA